MPLMKVLEAFSKRVLVGHRGHPAKELENTLESIESAIKSGAHIVEVDIQKTKDGVLVLSHDENLERVYGKNINIREASWQEIKEIRKGNYRVARLEEALDLINGRVVLFLEIKNPQDTEDIIKLLESKRALDWSVIISFYPEAIEKAKGKVTTGLVYSRPPGMIPEAKKLGCSLVLPKYTLATQKAIDFAHKLKLKVVAWTVNDIQKAKELLERGVDGIATDNVEMLKALFL